MFVCSAENSKGDIITLTQNERDFQLLKVDGLNPPNAAVNLTNIAGMDGAVFNSAKLETREIVIYIRLSGHVEANRIKLYSFFPTKELCRLYFKTEIRDVFIEGYVQTVDVSPFSASEIMQISVICPDTYFKGVNRIIADLSHVSSLFEFPFSINYNLPVEFSRLDTNKITNVYNASESESGVTIYADISLSVSKILIRNIDTGEYFGISGNFLSGDSIFISTYRGKKAVTLTRQGVKVNLFSKIITGSAFFQLCKGDNYFGYSVDDSLEKNSRVGIKFKYRTNYRGI